MSSNDSLTSFDLPVIKNLAERLNDGLAAVDSGGRVLFVNTAWANLHGYTIDELSGTALDVFHTKDQLAKGAAKFLGEIAAASPNSVKIDRRKKDGSIFSNSTSVIPLKAEGGNSECFLIIAHEMTDEILQESQRK